MSEKKLSYVSIHVRVLSEQYEWLRKYCFDQRISQAEVIREALELYRKEKEEEKMSCTVDGTDYVFQLWGHPNGARALVGHYEEGGESFSIWSAEAGELPASQEEAEDFLHNLDWAVEDMTSLRREGFRPL